MKKIFTLRNIIPFLVIFMLTSCYEKENELQSISSEDNYSSEVSAIKTVQDKETGRVVYIVTKN